MRQYIARLLPCLGLAWGLFTLPSVVADEDEKTFVVQAGHLSTSVRELVDSHGWTLVWDSEEDRIIKRSFNVPNPSLEECLSGVLARYGSIFAVNLDQTERVVYVTTSAGAYVGEASGSGDSGLQWSDELVFEPDLKPASPPEPPPFEEQKLTVRMLDTRQLWKNDEPESDSSAPTPEAGPKPSAVPLHEALSPEKPEFPATALDSKADTPPGKAPKASGAARPVLQIMSVKDREKAESERAKLQALGHDVFLEEFNHDGTLWHRLKIRVKPAQSIEDTKENLKSLGHDAIWVVPQDIAKKQLSIDE